MKKRLILWIALVLGAHVAQAEFAVCNNTIEVVNTAVGYAVANDFETKGWWTIGPNQCANVITEELTSRYVYVFAQDVLGKPILNGTTELCVSEEKFSQIGAESCWARGLIGAKFIEVDTRDTSRWTLFLSPEGAFSN